MSCTNADTISVEIPGTDWLKPEWGLTWAIPEGATIAWGARAIYTWVTANVAAKTPTGRLKMSRGRPVTVAMHKPSIDLVYNRMGWSEKRGSSDPATQAGELEPEEYAAKLALGQ